MAELPQRERHKIVREELDKLRQLEYINRESYQQVIEGLNHYRNEQLKQQSPPLVTKPMEKVQVKEVEKQKPIIEKVEKPKKVKTPEQIRERNITWSLILGVIFLLIGGLVLATSTWEQMGPILKVITLSFVSLFFLGLSVICSKFLKIEKTAFAFLTLGSMLIPITVVAIGYFELLGSYLSLTGEGRYLLGLLGTLLPLPLYVRNGYRHQSRLFVWISYLFLSFSVGFLIAAMQVPIDLFYLLIMVFNAGLLYGYHRFKNNQSFKLFIKELPSYAQLNIIVSTLLMLFVFEQELFYSFNILITAALYIAMVFLYNTKEYQFIFSALIAYGIYQLVENSFLQSIDLAVYPAVGLLYLSFAFVAKKHAFIQKMFTYTSSLISLLAFIYVSYQGLVIRSGEDSFILLLGYIVIAANYIYLAYITKRAVFTYLAPIFLLAVGMQLWNNIDAYFLGNFPGLFMFLYSILLFLFIGIWNKNKYFRQIRISTYLLSTGAMFISVMYELVNENYFVTAFMFAIVGVLAIIVVKQRPVVEKKLASWIHASSWLFALFVLYPALEQVITGYGVHVTWTTHIAASSLLLLAISLLWKKEQMKGLEVASFYTGQVAYLYGLLHLANDYQINETFVRPLLLLIGVGVFTPLVRRARANSLWLVVAITTYAFYASLLSTFSIDSFAGTIVFLLFGVVLLLAIAQFIGEKVNALIPYFFWLAHSIQLLLVLVVLLDQVISQAIHPLVMLIPFSVYVYSALIKRKEWQIKVHLYLAMTLVPLLIVTVFPYYQWFDAIPTIYGWLVASGIFAMAWVIVNPIWKKRLEWYMIPFSNYGLFLMIAERSNIHIVEIIPIIAYIVLNLFFLHKRKWSLLTILPLLVSMGLWEQFRYMLDSSYLLIACLVSFVILFVAGRYLYSELYQWEKQHKFIDWYSVTAALYLVFALSFIPFDASVWIQIIPYVLFTVWLFAQSKRLRSLSATRVFKTVGATSILPTYYLVLAEYKPFLPSLFHAELNAIPWLVIPIVLSLTTWKSYQRVMHTIQFAILLLVTTYLVIDAIQSNTIWDALIIGTLSLLSVLIGMQMRIKSYFFVGVGTLLFNVIYQTKPFWGNMPWWGYLLIAGFTLITVASYNEWQKQRTKESKLKKLMQKLKANFREWN